MRPKQISHAVQLTGSVSAKFKLFRIKIAKTMKKDSSEVVATSSDLCDVDQTILVLNDEKNIVINSKKRVRTYKN